MGSVGRAGAWKAEYREIPLELEGIYGAMWKPSAVVIPMIYASDQIQL